MNELDTVLPETLDRVRAQGTRAPQHHAKAEVIKRIRRRRAAGTASALAATAVLVGAGIFATEVLSNQGGRTLEGQETKEATGVHEPLPEPPQDLAARVGPDVRHLIVPGLVLLYREDDGDYHAAIESVGNAVTTECPQPLTKEACPQASAALWTVHEDGSSDTTLGDFFDVPEVPEGAEVLWEAVPDEGAIGIDSVGACDRIERFVPDYECEEGEPVEADSKTVRFVGRDSAVIPATWHRDHVDWAELNVSTSIDGAAYDEGGIASDQAFVTVNYVSQKGESDELPEELDPDGFENSEDSVHGEPVRTFSGAQRLDPGVICYICYDIEIAYWVGPDASRTTWAQARFIVESLELSGS